MSGEISLDFDGAAHALPALQAAAYRLIGTAHCDITANAGGYRCRLTPVKPADLEILRAQFLDLVTDENVRASIHERTDPVRNVILSLAFGSLAASPRDSS
jgi:His-Xaa-Ser system protein HxsD